MIKITTKDQIYFSRRLNYLLGAGIGLKESMSILLEQSASKKHKLFFQNIATHLSSGKTLATSLSLETRSFDELSLALIAIGEECGALSKNLKHLSDELTKKHLLKRKIISSLVYPVFIGFATLLLSLFLVTYIFPKIRPLFTSMNISLPWTTRTLIFMSDIIHFHILLILSILLFVGITSITLYKKNTSSKPKLQFFLLKIFFVKTLIQNYWIATSMCYIHILLQGNVQINISLSLISDAISFIPYKTAFADISQQTTAGKNLGHSFSKFPSLFPKLVPEMISLGESTGSLVESCKYLQEIYEQEIDEMTKAISSSLEPLLMISMGCIVGFIALSIITPLYAITQNIH